MVVMNFDGSVCRPFTRFRQSGARLRPSEGFPKPKCDDDGQEVDLAEESGTSLSLKVLIIRTFRLKAKSVLVKLVL